MSTARRLFPDMSEKRIDKAAPEPAVSVASLLVADDRAGGRHGGRAHAHHPGGHRGRRGFIPPARRVWRSPTSMFLMRIPGYEGPEGETLVFADCGVVIAPTPPELAEIAVLARRAGPPDLFGWEPRVAHALLLHQGQRLRRIGEEGARSARPRSGSGSRGWPSTGSCSSTPPSCRPSRPRGRLLVSNRWRGAPTSWSSPT